MSSTSERSIEKPEDVERSSCPVFPARLHDADHATGDVSFRSAGKTEMPMILSCLKDAACWLQGRDIDYWQNWLEPEEGHIAWVREGFDREEFYMVENEGVPVGCFRLQWQDAMFWGEQADDAGYVHSFTIHRSLAGRNIGRRVLDLIAAFCLEQGKAYLRLDCGSHVTGLCRYYESCGFVAKGQVTVYGERLVLYEKELTPAYMRHRNEGI